MQSRGRALTSVRHGTCLSVGAPEDDKSIELIANLQFQIMTFHKFGRDPKISMTKMAINSGNINN